MDAAIHAKAIDMNTLTYKSPNVVIWIAGIAVILFCATGIAAIMGWIPTSMVRNADKMELVDSGTPPTATVKPAAAKRPASSESYKEPVAVKK